MPLGDSGGVVQRIHLHTDHYSACETLTYLPVIAKLYWVSSQMCSQMRGQSVQRTDSGIHICAVSWESEEKKGQKHSACTVLVT